MSNGRGIWNEYYRDSICDTSEIIEDLEKELKELNKPKKAKSILDYLKPSFYKKPEKELEKKKEIEQRIVNLRKNIKKDRLEMYD